MDSTVGGDVDFDDDCGVELLKDSVDSIFKVDLDDVVVSTKLSFTQSVLRFDSPLASFHLPPSIEKNST